jgi:hypothetical protein
LERAEGHALSVAANPSTTAGLPVGVRPPLVPASHRNLLAAYVLVPALALLHRALPHVVVEAASLNIADHLHGDWWPEHSLIRIECHHRPATVAYTLLHEFGHAFDDNRLDWPLRAELLEHGGLTTWDDPAVPWEERGQEWFAEGFAHAWWPARLRPVPRRWSLQAPLPCGHVQSVFEIEVASRRWRRLFGASRDPHRPTPLEHAACLLPIG